MGVKINSAKNVSLASLRAKVEKEAEEHRPQQESSKTSSSSIVTKRKVLSALQRGRKGKNF